MKSNLTNSKHHNQLFHDLVSNLEKLIIKDEERDTLDFCKNGFKFLIDELTHSKNIQFSTFFSQLAYAANTYRISGVDLYLSHLLRKYIQTNEPIPKIDMKGLCLYVLYHWCKKLDPSILCSELEKIERPEIPTDKSAHETFISTIKFVALQVNVKRFELLGYTEEDPHLFRTVAFNLPHRNELFTENLLEMDQYMRLPVTLNLINVAIGDDNVLRPEGFVIDPDFLIDVTAVSQCFSTRETNTLGHLTKKYLKVDSNINLILGNIANMMLDELVYKPDIKFEEVAPKLFTISPISLSLMSDESIRDLIQRAQSHFINLKLVVNRQFKEVNIQTEKCYLEPTFYSVKYGLQGRLDLYRQDDEAQEYDIIELKSGRPYQPNAYGINHNHYIQTILYDLIVRHVLPPKVKPKSYILYSSQSEKALRFAPVLKSQQMDAIKVRNTIRIIEEMLSVVDDTDFDTIFDYLNPNDISGNWKFVKRDLTKIMNVISHLSPLELEYFKQFTGLIAREHHIAKIGTTAGDGRGGFASLWCQTIQQKEQLFSSLLYLQIATIKAGDETPLIILHRPAEQESLTKFRKGDIAVLYPHLPRAKQPLSSQVFKCTILEINAETVTIRLRNLQQNFEVFNQYPLWNMDSDLIDSSFNSMYSNLFAFFEAEDRNKALIFGTEKPQTGSPLPLKGSYRVTDNQYQVISEAIAAPDYYLIWGPPGTGKTSKVLYAITHELYAHHQQSILIVSFTNRAVDEICSAVLSDSYLRENALRIGSRYSCGSSYVDLLLSSQMKTITSRAALKEFLSSKRVVVSTVSSLMGKREIFDLIDFDVVIVDEASQLLEPMLIGLLPHVPKWILIGDHQQLPAVVTQDVEQSAVDNVKLNEEISLINCRNSLFERLIMINQNKNWLNNIGVLTEQGRMHQEIMKYVNTHFYKQQLQTISSLERLHQPTSPFLLTKMQYRLCFINCQKEEDFTRRQNTAQAMTVTQLIQQYADHLKDNQIPKDQFSIGVIAPFRSQIALIGKYLHQAQIDLDVTVDTVERYQGGAKDVIIYSTTINHPHQFRQIVSLSSEGVDRKLNVAITRAREQFILLGDKSVLTKNNLYNYLIQESETITLDVTKTQDSP